MVRITGTSYNDNGTFQIEPTPIWPGNPAPPRIRFFPVLEGTSEDDEIFGVDGDDIALGNGGDDSIFGGNDNDSLSGGDGNDFLTGADLGLNLGFGEIDSLTGGTGLDTFVLGDSENVYYDDGNDSIFSSDLGTTDYALIADFVDGEDTIQLKGGLQYRLETTTVGENTGVGIYVEKGSRWITIGGGGGIFGSLPLRSIPVPIADELVGIVTGAELSALTISNGDDITTIA